MNSAEFLEWMVSKKEDGFDSVTIDELVATFIAEGLLTKGYMPYEPPKK